MSDDNDPVFFKDDLIKTPHGFFSRRGGISTGLYSSLNCGWGSKDNPNDITTNRALVLQSLGPSAQDLVTAAQVHSNKVKTVDKIWTRDRAPELDALVTKQSGIALGILTADCAPVLFHDPVHQVIGAAHAGWRGAFDGVLENTVQAMIALGAEKDHIHASVGPCIHQPSYEVDQGFLDRFLDQKTTHDRFFKSSHKENHHLFDLPRYVELRLQECGLTSISSSKYDTYKEEELFYSYRRKTHRGEADYARHISVIVLD